VIANGQAIVHPIELSLFNCLRAVTVAATTQRADCYQTAAESWQKAVTDDYQKLLPRLSSDLQDLLKEEQQSWEKFRDEHEKFVLAKYSKRKGSGSLSARLIELAKPDKERAMELEGRLEQSTTQIEEKPNE
jgi:uncharacterized protein YecT (DUF1311 family)